MLLWNIYKCSACAPLLEWGKLHSCMAAVIFYANWILPWILAVFFFTLNCSLRSQTGDLLLYCMSLTWCVYVRLVCTSLSLFSTLSLHLRKLLKFIIQHFKKMHYTLPICSATVFSATILNVCIVKKNLLEKAQCLFPYSWFCCHMFSITLVFLFPWQAQHSKVTGWMLLLIAVHKMLCLPVQKCPFHSSNWFRHGCCHQYHQYTQLVNNVHSFSKNGSFV